MTYYNSIYASIHYKREEYYQDEVAFNIFSASSISSGVVTCKAQDKITLVRQCTLHNVSRVIQCGTISG